MTEVDDDGRHPYYRFESEATQKLDAMFLQIRDPDLREMIRLQALQTRIWCRDFWIASGKQSSHPIPKQLTFKNK